MYVAHLSVHGLYNINSMRKGSKSNDNTNFNKNASGNDKHVNQNVKKRNF